MRGISAAIVVSGPLSITIPNPKVSILRFYESVGWNTTTVIFFFWISKDKGEFDWDTTTQSIILGSFYWCYVLSQVIGGLLTQYFGTKVVFGFSQFVTAICSLLIPHAAVIHYVLVIILRSIQGIASVNYSKFISYACFDSTVQSTVQNGANKTAS